MVKKKKIALTLIAGLTFFVSAAFAGGGFGGADGTGSGGGNVKDDFGGTVISREVESKSVD